MRVSNDKINSSLKRQLVKTFAQTLSDFKNMDEALSFIKDFLTDKESETLAKRLAVAYWLKNGRTYPNIKKNLKVSSATIAEVSSIMNKKGFNLALKKIEAEEWANHWAKKIKRIIK